MTQYFYSLYMLLTWANPGMLAELDLRPLSLATTAAHAQIDGFKTLAECQAYKFDATTFPLTLNGAPFTFVVSGRSCRKYPVTSAPPAVGTPPNAAELLPN